MKTTACAASLAALCLVHAACAPASYEEPSGDEANRTREGLQVCAKGSTSKGIDVSEHNGHVDWAEVKASGRTFAFARVSDGLDYVDTEFAANWAGMKAAGLVRGAYQYFRPGQDPVQQANLLLSKIGTLGPGDLPPVIDVETANGQSGTTVVNGVRAWVDRVKAQTGRDPIIYAAAGFWDTLPSTAQFAPYPLWVANYGQQCPYLPGTWTKWSFWQSSESGSVPGVSGAVDLNHWNGTLEELLALASGAAPLGPGCTSDDHCHHGAPGAATVCANTGAAAGHCIDGCHTDADCPAGGTCDESQAHWQCTNAPPALGTPCTSDAQCGGPGSARVCGASSHTCIIGCHADADCPASTACDTSGAAWFCAPTDKPENGCPVLTYPSGIKIQTVPNAAMTATYEGHLKAGETAPKCFLDVTKLYDPDTHETYDLSVEVAAHFQLAELVGTEVDQGYGNFVLLSPAAVASLEAFRQDAGVPVYVNSGYRSPKHQEDVCESICGDPYGCPGLCSNNSRHMWGDAFDLPLEFYGTYYTQLACDDGFKFAYLESGTHLHVDQNPAYAQCVQQ